MHRDITYLNEPRYLWYSAFPETDIWTSRAEARRGRLSLTGKDADHDRAIKLSRLFRLATFVKGRPVFVEKLPINNFRLSFIRQLFPDARFIHIYRNGLEVAKSIEKVNLEGGWWFGENLYKWDMLADYAKSQDSTKNLPETCTTHYYKGLLEWRLSTEAVVDFLNGSTGVEFLEINYDDLIDNPVSTVARALEFIGVDFDPVVKDFVAKTISRRSAKLSQSTISDQELLIGGKLLRLSTDGQGQLTERCA